MKLHDIIITAITASIPLVILYIGYRIERRQNRIEGKHRNRIQFELEASFFGPQVGFYIAEITLLLHNKGLVRNIIKELPLSIRGIEKDTAINLFKKEGEKIEKSETKSIADFPIALVNTNMLERENVENKKEAWFVEPGVVQKFTYVARIPEQIQFILVASSFKYHNNSVHSAKRVFEVQVVE